MGHGGEIRHCAVGEFRVRNIDGCLVETAHAGGAEADMLHRPLDHAIHLHPVTDAEAFFDEDGKTGQQVLEQILRTERHRDTEQAETCDQRGDLDAPDLQHGGDAQQDHRDPRGGDQPVHHFAGQHHFKALEGQGQRLGEIVGRPEEGHGHHGADEPQMQLLRQPVKGEVTAGDEDTDGEDHQLEGRGQRFHQQVIHLRLGARGPFAGGGYHDAGEQAAQDVEEDEDAERHQHAAEINALDAVLPDADEQLPEFHGQGLEICHGGSCSLRVRGQAQAGPGGRCGRYAGL